MADSSQPPSSQAQADRPIAFALLRDGVIVNGGYVTLIIRPEDLTHDTPSRTNPQQTIGGFWINSSGTGLQTINIQGHTGWRGAIENGERVDGIAQFAKLRDNIFQQWHTLRAQQEARGIDPDKSIELIFVDELDDISVVVAPGRFTLRRSRSRPLLKQYSFPMTVIRQAEDSAQVQVDALIDDGLVKQKASVDAAAIDALARSQAQRPALAASIQQMFPPSVGVLSDLVLNSAALLGKVIAAANDVDSLADAAAAPVVAASAGGQHCIRKPGARAGRAAGA